jgi:hypothetical protein
MSELENLFVNGSKLIDNLDVYKNLNGRNLHYTNKLLKKNAELDSLNKSIKNMKKELNNVNCDSDSIIATLKTIQNEI